MFVNEWIGREGRGVSLKVRDDLEEKKKEYGDYCLKEENVVSLYYIYSIENLGLSIINC